MKLATAPSNKALMSSNIGDVSEFNIKATAKSFSILSSGLYANKIRAIIRELSCNALDSHVDAGKANVPFELHLPSLLEPWFAIRDFGTGLTHDQVVNIYTTFFESTKTDSNDFVGALGLGSKSPFSYTDNFTVVAIVNRVKTIFTAFINDAGVPSVALMGTDKDCNEPNGVEVKFAVTDSSDYYAFSSEASNVFTYFDVQPISTGYEHKVIKPEYAIKDLLPGIHLRQPNKNAIAVMGNIAYPINVPHAQDALGDDLADILSYPLELHFELGELDFQASREGLSYIPSTVNAIKDKLIKIQSHLSVYVSDKLSGTTNAWKLKDKIVSLLSHNMLRASIRTYCADTSFPFYDNTSHYSIFKTLDINVLALEQEYNLKANIFYIDRWSDKLHNIKPSVRFREGDKDLKYELKVESDSLQFVFNDTKIGAVARAKAHFKNLNTKSDVRVVVLSAFNKKSETKINEFYKSIYNPTSTMLASDLDMIVRKPVRSAKSVKSVLSLQIKDRYNRKQVLREDKTDFATLSADTILKYYVPVSGLRIKFAKQSEYNMHDLVYKVNLLSLLPKNVKIYGLSKLQIADIDSNTSWVNFEDAVYNSLSNLDQRILFDIARNECFNRNNLVVRYNPEIINLISKESTFATTSLLFTAKPLKGYSTLHTLILLSDAFGFNDTLTDKVKAIVTTINNATNKYPLLNSADDATIEDVADYINYIDNK